MRGGEWVRNDFHESGNLGAKKEREEGKVPGLQPAEYRQYRQEEMNCAC
jgi:hypothetical protein